MEIEHVAFDSKGAFKVNVDGRDAAKMTYSKAGDKMMIIDHTEVGDELRGKGVGLQLVKAAVAFAREHQIIVLPLCPFAKSVFDKTPELQDVLKNKN